MRVHDSGKLLLVKLHCRAKRKFAVVEEFQEENFETRAFWRLLFLGP